MDDRTLHFEASGALRDASLVMRDKETDSWWSVMQGRAIDGEMDGVPLREMVIAEKAQWGDWRRRHPDTLVLSVNGRTHVEGNPYEGYFESQRTYRSIRPEDDRLPGKTPILAFRLEGVPYAIPHDAIRGGRFVQVGGPAGTRLFFWRRADAAIFQSSFVYRADGITGEPDEPLHEQLRETGERLPAIDTYWYTWIAQNEDTELLR